MPLPVLPRAYECVKVARRQGMVKSVRSWRCSGSSEMSLATVNFLLTKRQVNPIIDHSP